MTATHRTRRADAAGYVARFLHEAMIASARAAERAPARGTEAASPRTAAGSDVAGLPGGAAAYVLDRALRRGAGPMVVVTPDMESARRTAADALVQPRHPEGEIIKEDSSLLPGNRKPIAIFSASGPYTSI